MSRVLHNSLILNGSDSLPELVERDDHPVTRISFNSGWENPTIFTMRTNLPGQQKDSHDLQKDLSGSGFQRPLNFETDPWGIDPIDPLNRSDAAQNPSLPNHSNPVGSEKESLNKEHRVETQGISTRYSLGISSPIGPNLIPSNLINWNDLFGLPCTVCYLLPETEKILSELANLTTRLDFNLITFYSTYADNWWPESQKIIFLNYRIFSLQEELLVLFDNISSPNLSTRSRDLSRTTPRNFFTSNTPRTSRVDNVSVPDISIHLIRLQEEFYRLERKFYTLLSCKTNHEIDSTKGQHNLAFSQIYSEDFFLVISQYIVELLKCHGYRIDQFVHPVIFLLRSDDETIEAIDQTILEQLWPQVQIYSIIPRIDHQYIRYNQNFLIWLVKFIRAIRIIRTIQWSILKVWSTPNWLNLLSILVDNPHLLDQFENISDRAGLLGLLKQNTLVSWYIKLDIEPINGRIEQISQSSNLS